jgi:hypothetical protein
MLRPLTLSCQEARCCTLTVMSRVLIVLVAALATACAAGTGFEELPLPARIALLVAACGFAAGSQMGDISKLLACVTKRAGGATVAGALSFVTA